MGKSVRRRLSDGKPENLQAASRPGGANVATWATKRCTPAEWMHVQSLISSIRRELQDDPPTILLLIKTNILSGVDDAFVGMPEEFLGPFRDFSPINPDEIPDGVIMIYGSEGELAEFPEVQAKIKIGR
jgi:hypothetical protein